MPSATTPDEEAATAWLELDQPNGLRRFPLDPGRVCRIGRSEAGTVVLADDRVSRNHAMVQSLDAGAFALIDLGSANGTYVDGRRVCAPTVLKDGDCITVGQSNLRFRQSAVAIPADLPRHGRSDTQSTNIHHAEKLITVLVVDIRDYTKLARKLDAGTLSEVVGTFFRESAKPLIDAGAWAQKYIGDAIMAVWIHENSDSRVGAEILGAAQALVSVAGVADALQNRFSLPTPIRIGAALNSGSASVGNVGGIAADDYTAVGDVVNRAFRLESATKEISCDVLIGEETLTLLPDGSPIPAVLKACNVSLKGYETASPAWATNFGALSDALARVRRPT